MTYNRLCRIAPTLLLLGAMPLAAFAAAGSTERDTQFEAVKALVDRDFRLPAKRQLADFIAANHKDATWTGKFLSWYYADRFRIASSDQSEKAALASEAAALLAEFEAAAKSNQLPPELASHFTGTGRILRLVNDVRAVVNPDLPAPLVKETLSVERRAALNDGVKALIVAAQSTYDAGMAKVAANADAEKAVESLADNDPKRVAAMRAGVMMRLDALRPMYYAYSALREVAERGKDFGIEPAPAQEFIQDWALKNYKKLEDLDYFWGDFHLEMHSFTIILMAQAARYKVKDLVLDEVEEAFMKTIRMVVTDEFKGASSADLEGIRTLQVRTWADLITWYRDLGVTVGPRQWSRGAEIFLEFKERAKTDRNLRLDHPDRTRQVEVARVYLAAARLLKTKGDTAGASAAASAVSSVRNHPLSYHAAQWLSSFTRDGSGGSTGGGWSGPAVASDPSEAIATAAAFMKAATQNSDPALARATYLTAATVLRNAVLGLRQDAFADRADEVAPEVFYRYAQVMAKLDMRWHAAIVGQAGLMHLQTRMAELKDKAPWKKNGEGKWIDGAKYISYLAGVAMDNAGYLQRIGKGPGAASLYQDIISLVKKISPIDAGKSMDWTQVILLIQDKNWTSAETQVRTYQKAYPEDYFKAEGALNRIRLGRISDAKSPEESKRLTEELLKDAEKLADKAAKELESEKDPVRRRTLMSAVRDVFSLRARTCVSQGKNDDVLKMLGPDYWKAQPDEDVALEMLGMMCSAIQQRHKDITTDQKKLVDAKLLFEWWPSIAFAYEVWQKQKERLPGKSEQIDSHGRRLGWVFNVISSTQVPAMRSQPDAPAQLGDVHVLANQAFADITEPTLNEQTVSDPKTRDLCLRVANILWELDQHPRAARLYALFIDRLAADPELAALRDTPKPTLDALDPILTARPELKIQWAVVRDLLEDAPDLKRKILEQDLPPKEWGEKKRDFGMAVEALQALRKDSERSRMSIGATYVTLEAGLKKLEAQAGQLARHVAVTAKLAMAYREQGDKAKANALYEKLIDYDPTNPDFLAATVELVVDRIKAGEKIDDKDIEAAQIKAARVRDAALNGSATQWTARIQILELMVARKEFDKVKKALKFAAVDGSTPFDDLQLRPRNQRDAKRVNRAANALAVDLCRRYLAIVAQPGVEAKPSHAITTIEIDSRQNTIFVPNDGSKFKAVSREIGDDGTVVWFLWDEGKEPPPEPEAKAPEPTVVEPAKPPEAVKPPEAKP